MKSSPLSIQLHYGLFDLLFQTFLKRSKNLHVCSVMSSRVRCNYPNTLNTGRSSSQLDVHHFHIVAWKALIPKKPLLGSCHLALYPRWVRTRSSCFHKGHLALYLPCRSVQLNRTVASLTQPSKQQNFQLKSSHTS